MRTYRLDHLSDHELLRSLATLIAEDRTSTATIVAHIAEVDARRLYLPAGFPSMHAYCVEYLHLSDDEAYKRIQAARHARKIPMLFEAIADGRLHLTAVLLLGPRLTSESASELIDAAAGKGKAAIELMLAEFFPKPNVPTRLRALPVNAAPSALHVLAPSVLPSTETAPELVPEPVEFNVNVGSAQPSRQVSTPPPQLAPEQVPVSAQTLASLVSNAQVDVSSAPAAVSHASAREPARPKLAPLSPERFALQVTIDKSTRDLLRYAQELLSHSVPPGDIASVLHRALAGLVKELERQKFAATCRAPKARPGRASKRPRHIPAQLKRAVWDRDQAQCTYVSDSGQRCSSRTLLEFDHADPVACGGQATLETIRLRCRAHNQFVAERVFGKNFMQAKRNEARTAAAARNKSATARPSVSEPSRRTGG